MRATPPSTPKPRRRWLQFSLRRLLVAMLVFGCGLGWFAHEVQLARQQREAVTAIGKLGAGLSYGSESGGMTRTAVTWVGKLLGEDLRVNVTSINLERSQVTGAGNIDNRIRRSACTPACGNQHTNKSYQSQDN